MAALACQVPAGSAEALRNDRVHSGRRGLETLAQLVHRHRADDSVDKAVAKLIRADPIIVDDAGLLPTSADGAEALFLVVDAAYEKRSIAISSNIIRQAGVPQLSWRDRCQEQVVSRVFGVPNRCSACIYGLWPWLGLRRVVGRGPARAPGGAGTAAGARPRGR
jgi:hypothetical protein